MVQQQVMLGVVALLAGALAGVVLFVPFVVASYRRYGELPLVRLLTWSGALVYFWAIWSYTLLPLPDPHAMTCAGVNLNPFEAVAELAAAYHRAGGRPAAFLADAAVMQLALNVLLFVPLGFLLRVLARRGVVTATLTGFLISAFVETTQLTGVWGIYPCAYRVFDVDDLAANTLGALAGSLLALVFVGRRRPGPAGAAPQARPVTKARRLIGMVSDATAFFLATAAVTVALRIVWLYVLRRGDLRWVGDAIGWVGVLVPLAAWIAVTLSTGRTPGDLAIGVRYEGGRLPAPVARILRLAGGIGLYGALYLLGGGWAALATLFALAAVIATLSTRNGRGLPGVFSGQRVVAVAPSRAPASALR